MTTPITPAHRRAAAEALYPRAEQDYRATAFLDWLRTWATDGTEPTGVRQELLDQLTRTAQAIAAEGARRDAKWRDKLTALVRSLQESLSECDYNDERMSVYQRHHRMLVDLLNLIARANG